MKVPQGPLAVLLSCTLCTPASLGYAQQTKPDSAAIHTAPLTTYRSTQMGGDERIIHALNRFTFGPRSGDVEAVRSIGLDKWFDQQLHPETLDETDLNTRLAEYPAMHWTTAQLFYYLPGNGIIRRAINDRVDIPTDPVLHAIYENQIERIQAKRANKTGNGQATPAQAGSSMNIVSSAMNSGSDAADDPNPMSAPSGANDMNAAEAVPMMPQFSRTSIAGILALEPQQRVAHLAGMEPQQFDSFMKTLRPAEHRALADGLTPAQMQTVGALENPERLVAEELIATRLTHDIYSNAQLQEVMTDFWLNHFNVYLRKNPRMPYYLVSYERDTVRPHAMGKFENLLEAVAHSPAMLLYLDNAVSIGPDSIAARRAEMRQARGGNPQKKNTREGLNENYARELMELHTVGVNGGYTQGDVIQAARILTGWTIDRPLRDASFTFNANRHEPGTKTVMGRKFREGGEGEGHELLHMLTTRPATAQFICRELAIRFVSDAPPQTLIDRMAKTYLSSDGDISAILRTLFHSPEFWSTSTYRAKIKTPLEFVVSAVRASGATINNLRPIENNLRQMGMPTYGAVPPTGYKWDASTWVSTGALVDRMNFALNLAAGHLPGIKIDWSQIASQNISAVSTAPSPEAEEARLQSIFIPGGVSETTRTAALKQFDAQSSQTIVTPTLATMRPQRAVNTLERENQVLAGMLIGSPEFQRR